MSIQQLWTSEFVDLIDTKQVIATHNELPVKINLKAMYSARTAILKKTIYYKINDAITWYFSISLPSHCKRCDVHVATALSVLKPYTVQPEPVRILIKCPSDFPSLSETKGSIPPSWCNITTCVWLRLTNSTAATKKVTVLYYIKNHSLFKQHIVCSWRWK